jgi:hypothetical protein
MCPVSSEDVSVCLKEGVVGLVKITVGAKQAIVGGPSYTVAPDDDRCIDITTELRADHSGRFPAYRCLTGATIVIGVNILPRKK